jgi:hypothetical protein
MPHPEQPSYEELAARNAALLAVVAEQAALIESLRAEVAALRRQAGRDSSNSSQPPSQDGPAAKAGQREARRARPGRPQGGQKGHPGASLAWTARPDEILAVEPHTCGGCGADLAGAPGRVASSVQVAGIPPAALTVTEYRMMRRTCGCGQVTTAPPPGVSGGPVCYGPGVTGAATLLASTDRDRDRAGRGPDGRPVQGAGLHRVRLPLPGPPGRGVNRRLETTDATVPGSQMTAPVHARLAGRHLLPDEHLVDSGYPTAELLVSSLATFGITLVTPMLADTSAQARAGDATSVAQACST